MTVWAATRKPFSSAGSGGGVECPGPCIAHGRTEAHEDVCIACPVVIGWWTSFVLSRINNCSLKDFIVVLVCLDHTLYRRLSVIQLPAEVMP